MMDNSCGVVKMEDHLDLPPGFRFHPTDEELITHYLSKKVLDSNFMALAIGEVDMNKVEPWELPWRAKLGEKEWYFFCMRDKKYPTGLRTNRATASGYWKATGKDKEIFRGKHLVGMKKTLVFYKGRAPKGEKSNWVIHEYRLEGKFSLNNLPKQAKNDWVISRVFHKTNGGKKVHISGLMRPNEMPPLMDPSNPVPAHVHCFSNSIVAPDQKIQDDFTACLNNPMFGSSSNAVDSFSRGQFNHVFPGLNQGSFVGISYGQNMNQGFGKEKEMVSLSQDTENSSVLSNLEMGKKAFQENEGPSTSVGPQDLDCIWSY